MSNVPNPFLSCLKGPDMVKFQLPSALARNAWRAFNAGLFLVVIGMVPLLLSVTSRTRLDTVFLAGIVVVSVGGTLFLVSSCVAICDHIQNGMPSPPGGDSAGDLVWTVDAPPSYEEAVAAQPPPPAHLCNQNGTVAVDGVIITVHNVNNPTAATKPRCVTLTSQEPKTSMC